MAPWLYIYIYFHVVVELLLLRIYSFISKQCNLYYSFQALNLLSVCLSPNASGPATCPLLSLAGGGMARQFWLDSTWEQFYWLYSPNNCIYDDEFRHKIYTFSYYASFVKVLHFFKFLHIFFLQFFWKEWQPCLLHKSWIKKMPPQEFLGTLHICIQCASK